MALVKCTECGKEISDQATACPSCGAQQQKQSELKRNVTKKDIAALLIVVAVVFAYLAISDKSGNSDATAANANESPKIETAQQGKPPQARIKPESIVMFPESSIACLSKDALSDAISHAANGESTKMKAMFVSKQHPNGECLMLSPDLKFKVLSAEYPDESSPVGLLEIVGVGSESAEGAWTLSVTAKLVN